MQPAGKQRKGRYERLLPTRPFCPSWCLSRQLGSIFVITLLVVFVCSNVPLPVAVLAIGLVISIVAVYGWWGSVVGWFSLLHMYINMACYVFLST
jgi:hypothetical protein